MQHEQVAENLSAYVEGTLSPAMVAAIENHLRECADCFVEEKTLRRVYSLLDSPAAVVEPPPSFHADTMRRVRVAQREKAVAPSRVPFWRRPIFAGVAAVTAAVVALAVYNSVPPGVEGSRAGYTLPVRGAVVTLRLGGDEAREVRLDAARLGSRTAGLAVVAVANGTCEQPTGSSSGTITIRPAMPGDVVEVTLGQASTGAVPDAQGWTVFMPSTGPAPASPIVGTGTVRDALSAVSRSNTVAIIAPSSVLAQGLRPVATGVPAASALADIAGQLQMRAELHNGSWYLLR